MSKDTPITIEELQKKIDQQAWIIKALDRAARNRHLKGEIFATAVSHYQAAAMRMLLTTPENRSQWITENTELRVALVEFGYCLECGCLDFCSCELDEDG